MLTFLFRLLLSVLLALLLLSLLLLMHVDYIDDKDNNTEAL